MRALVCHAYGPPETLVVEEVPDLAPGPGQVLVEVHASGVNYTDVLSTSGRSQLARHLPMTPGVEAAGIVRAVGEGVTRAKVGQRVLGHTLHGAMAEQCLFAEIDVAAIPDDMDMQTAATFFIASMTSDYALSERARLKAGENLLVVGAGSGAGIAAVQIGKAIGAHVVAAASSDEKLALAKAAGADACVRYPQGPLDLQQQKELVAELLSHAVREKRKTIGQISTVHDDAGYHVIYDAVGGSYAEPAMRAMGWEGRYCSVGFSAGVPKVSLGPLLFKNADIMGIQPADPETRSPGLVTDAMDRMIGWYRAGFLRPNVTEIFDLADAPKALALLADRKASGRVVILPRRA